MNKRLMQFNSARAFCLRQGTFLLCSIFILAINFYSLKCVAQEITIGVPLEEQPINIINSDHPLAQIALNAATQTLIRIDREKHTQIKLALADSFSVNQTAKSVELRLRAGVSFLNSKLVDEADLQASLRRCQNNLSSAFINKYQNAPQFEVFLKEQRLRILLKSEQGADAIFEFLDICPILEERSLALFAEDLGSANLVLGTGPYQIVSRVKNRELRMERAAKNNAWASVITARAFADAGHALTALRSGTIDAFYAQDREVIDRASQDPTLLIRTCGVYNIILRSGLEFSCSPYLDPGAIKYSAL